MMSVNEISQERAADCRAVVLATPSPSFAERDILSVETQSGGLFNYLLRVETAHGRYFFKQYLDDVPNEIYDLPEIPASSRSKLAVEVQNLAAQATAGPGEPVVPEIVHFDDARHAFLMAAAPGKEPLIEYLSRGEVPRSFVEEMPQVLAKLHQSTFKQHAVESLLGNREFRDFKLKLQYDDIAAKLDDVESAAVLACKAAYQKRADCVTHGDINSRNILVGPSSLGVIDFEQSHLGAPEYDLAYILCEVVISLNAAGHGERCHTVISDFLDRYFQHFDALPREKVESEMATHLAIQIIYRFWGPSRASWTFYVDEQVGAKLVDRCRAFLRSGSSIDQLLRA